MAHFEADISQKRRRKETTLAPVASPALAPLSQQTIQRVQSIPDQLSPNEVMTLQRTMGNAAVAGLLARPARSTPVASSAGVGIQRKLEVGPVDDRYEREADRIAQSVVRGGRAQHASASPSAEGVQRDPVGPEGGPLQGDLESRVRQSGNSGSALPTSVRSAIEPKLGADLGQVRVHTDNTAVQLSQEMGAKAFTHKNHIFYGKGHSPNDLKLTAHEAVHTIQQGAISQKTQRQEEEGISRDGAPRVSRLGATVQRWPSFLDKEKRRQKKQARWNMTDTDVTDYKLGEGGTANRVDQVKYNRGIGKSKQKQGFFKPNNILNKGEQDEEVLHEKGNRSVASSRLDQWLGLNILSEEIWAQHNGETGSVSAKVEGKPLKETVFNKQMPEDWDLNPDEVFDIGAYKKQGNRWHERTGDHYNYHDFSNPKTQKGLSDLQLLDSITGQMDRHGGNIYIDPQSGEVKGIDQDISFGIGHMGKSINELEGKYRGLPSLVDEKTANKILKKKAKNLPKVLQSQYGGNLTDREIKTAQARMRELKAYLKKLKKEKKLVKQWDDQTYMQQIFEEDKKNNWGGARSEMLEPSYLKRSVMEYAQSNDRELPEGNNDLLGQMVTNPLYEEELQNL